MVNYNRTTWVDGNTGGTPITAERLNNVEAALATIAPLVGTTTTVTTTSNTVTAVQTASGYVANGAVLVSPAPNTYYRFIGSTTPPFGRIGDSWDVVDLGDISAPTNLSLVSSDDFDGGKNLSPATALSLDSNRWGGVDYEFFRQSSDGLFVPINWPTTSPSRRYITFDKTQAGTSKMRAQVQNVTYATASTYRTVQVAVNVTDPTVSATAFTGYLVGMTTTSTGTTEDWTVTRYDSGTGTATIGQITRTRGTNPRSIIVNSDGTGGITVTVDGEILNSGTAFRDTATTPLTGRYAGLGGYLQTNATSPSMNCKAESWRLYA